MRRAIVSARNSAGAIQVVCPELWGDQPSDWLLSVGGEGPLPGAQVWIGFEKNDLNYPIYLGDVGNVSPNRYTVVTNEGDLIVGTGPTTVAALPPGPAGYALISNGAGALPSYEALPTPPGPWLFLDQPALSLALTSNLQALPGTASASPTNPVRFHNAVTTSSVTTAIGFLLHGATSGGTYFNGATAAANGNGVTPSSSVDLIVTEPLQASTVWTNYSLVLSYTIAVWTEVS